MTAKKDLKRRIRDRQSRTGESYTTARSHVLAQADEPAPGEPPSPIPVVELIDVTGDAARLGLRCDVLVAPALARQLDPVRALEALRDALAAIEHDPRLQLLRELALFGHSIERKRRTAARWWDDVKLFLERARVGIGGTTEEGDMLALHVDGVLVIAQVGIVPAHTRARPRRLLLTTVDSHWFAEGLVEPAP